MMIQNFRDMTRTGTSLTNRKYRATVDVVERKWFRNRIESKVVARDYGGNWYFADTGKFTPRYDVEELERAWRTQHMEWTDK